MLRHNLYIFIFLLSTSNIFCHGQHVYERLTSPTKLASGGVTLSDRRGDTFAVLDYQYRENDGDIRVDLNLRIKNWKNHTVKQCSYSLDRYWSMTKSNQLRRLKGTDDKVVLAWYDHEDNPRAFVVDLSTCFTMFLGPRHLHDPPIALPTNDGGLDVFVNNETFCKGIGKSCVVRYNSNLQVVGKPKPFDVDLHWLSLFVEPLENGNYVVHGHDHSFNNYKTILIDSSTGNQTNLLSLDQSSGRWPNIVYSGLSFCWEFVPLTQEPIQCSQFDDRGELIFNESVNFDGPTWPVLVRELADGELIVLVEELRRPKEENKPRDLKWAKISKNSGKTNFGYVHFDCTADDLSSDLMVYDVWQEGERTYLGYVCQDGDRYIYDVASF